MSELKKITECILSDARTLRQNALSAAENKCTLLLEKAQKEADKNYEILITQARDEALIQKERMINKAKRAQQNLLLSIKTEAIKSALIKAKEELINTNDVCYNKFLRTFLKKCSCKTGTVYLNSKDFQRLDKTTKSLLQNFKIHKDDNLEGGFIIKNGKLTENYTVNEIFTSYSEYLTDFLAKKLFV